MNANKFTPEIHLTLSSANLTSTTQPFNQLSIQSTSGGYNLTGYEVCLRSINIPYSFPSFLAASFIGYVWPATSTNPATAYTVSIPAYTTWDINGLNSLLESVMITNGHYLVNSAGQNVYYAQLSPNPPYYRTTYQTTLVPTSLPTGWTNPASFPFPVIASNVLLQISDSQAQIVLGFNAGTYPSATTGAIYNVNGQNAPQVNPYSTIIVKSNIAVEDQSLGLQDFL